MDRLMELETWTFFNIFSPVYLVPKPQLKYMLNGQVRVIWREEVTTDFNYKANICHISLITSMNIANPYSCPQFQAMTSCTVKNDSDMNIQQCTMQVSQYFEYTVYLNANHQSCQLRGEEVKIRPSLRSEFIKLSASV